MVSSEYFRDRHHPSDEAITEHMLHVAGDLPSHITMAPRGERKYIERRNRRHPQPAPITAEMLRRHLEGRITLGSWLANRDGSTWAIVWDADDAECWDPLHQPDRHETDDAAAQELRRDGALGDAARADHA